MILLNDIWSTHLHASHSLFGCIEHTETNKWTRQQLLSEQLQSRCTWCRWKRWSLSTYCSLSLCHRSHISGMQVEQRRVQRRVGGLPEKVNCTNQSDNHAYLACMLLCLSLDAQRSELLLITVSVMLHCHSLQVDRKHRDELSNGHMILN